MNRTRYIQGVKKRVSKKRFEHSLRTAEFARYLSSRYGEDEEKAWIAGILHDLGRELTDEEMKRIAAEKYSIEPWEEKKPKLLHGKAAAVIAENELGVKDPSILEAIAAHVTGRPEMDALSKIIFIADYLEPGRKHLHKNSGASLIDRFSLDQVLLFVLKEIIDYHKKEKKLIAEPALHLFDELNQNKITVKGESR